MGKIIKLSETQLNRIVTRVIKEQDQPKQEKPKEIKVTDWKIGQEIRNALTNYGFDADFNITPDGWITLKLTLGNTQLIGGYNPKTSAQKFNLTSGGQSPTEMVWNGDIGDFVKDIFKKITLNEDITKKVTINEINKLYEAKRGKGCADTKKGCIRSYRNGFRILNNKIGGWFKSDKGDIYDYTSKGDAKGALGAMHSE